MEKVIVPPDPERMIEGLRDTGYDFKTAVADIIDNSVAAQAKNIDIWVKMDFGGNIRVSIADDGVGMDRVGIQNAMKYGAQRRNDPASLGKFGLGLKTASTAFCRRLCVTSRADKNQQPIRAIWDLDEVAEKNLWELSIDLPDEPTLKGLESVASQKSGTIVVWEKVDRLLKPYKAEGGKPAQKALEKLGSELREHIAKVFQRFLDANDDRAKTVIMSLNGIRVIPWDPFCIGESELVATEIVGVDLPNGNEAFFEVKAFVLPRREEFSSEDAANKAKLTNDRQGIYVYRQERLINDSDWLGLFQMEPHGTLLRVQFSFDHDLDEAFRIDIKKSRIILHEDIREYLNSQFLPAPRRAANERYRKGQNLKAKELSIVAHDVSNKSIGAIEAEVSTSEITVTDHERGEVEVKNQQGSTRIKLKIGAASRPGQCYVEPVNSLDDGQLWEPALIDMHKAVRINTGHPYYHKVYIPNIKSGVTVRGMDSLLWSLCVAELGSINEETKRHFSNMRYEVSRILRRLVEDLPEPVMENGDDF